MFLSLDFIQIKTMLLSDVLKTIIFGCFCTFAYIHNTFLSTDNFALCKHI